MKKYIRLSSDVVTKHINIEIGIEIIDPQGQIAAASYKGFNVPDGKLLPVEKDAIVDSQALEDYHAFIDSIEDLIQDYYQLHVFYKNDSPDNSFYFGMLAKDSEGNLLLDFDFTLRVSTHPAHRTEQSQKHKKEKDAELAKVTNGKRTKPLRKYILVNDKEYDNYSEAYLAVDEMIASQVDIMRRNVNKK